MRKKKDKQFFSTFVDKSVADEMKKIPTGLGEIIVKEIKDVDMCEMVLETDDATAELVADIGRKMIRRDTEALFAYAVKKAIEDIVKEKSKK